MISEYPHKDTIVVTTQDLDEFKSLCDSLGIEYHVYARPSDPKDRGTCLIQVSMDNMHLLSISSNKISDAGLGGMRRFMGYSMLVEDRIRRVEMAKVELEILDQEKRIQEALEHMKDFNL